VLALFDTALGAVAPLDLRRPGEVSIYVCGPTVYGPPHLGHGRQVLVYDILRRYLRWSGLAVRFVSNVTDIDDRIIKRARVESRPVAELATQYEADWWAASDALGVDRPDDAPHATGWVQQMVDLTARFVAAGIAYETSDGVYFVASSVPDYGLLARQSIDTLRAGARVEVEENKRDPADFALWKKAKPGEPSWPSPWGEGRPGWHTECVVMSLGLLGDGFDLHTGGQELAFPHHENERAQAVAWGRAFSRRWMHHGWVVDSSGEKMSKSLGNFTNIPELLGVLDGDGRPLRLLVLQSHYRSPLKIGPQGIEQARAGVGRLDDFGRRFPPLRDAGGALDEDARARFRAAMDDDLNTSVATAVVFEQMAAAHRAADAGDASGAARAAATVRDLAGALGLFPGRPGADAAVPGEVAELVAARDAARRAGEWPRADALRVQLQSMGWVVEDAPGGTRVHR